LEYFTENTFWADAILDSKPRTMINEISFMITGIFLNQSSFLDLVISKLAATAKVSK
jgi:hypothetical protein